MQTYSKLITELGGLIQRGRYAAVKSVNAALVATYWLIGREIVEYEQKGNLRAEYGRQLLCKISEDLTAEFGRGFGLAQLKNIRLFYMCYREKSYTLSSQSKPAGKSYTLSSQFAKPSKELFVRFPLSWSHYCLLMRIDETEKRSFYEAECVRGNWSVRQLDRQIQAMLYERTSLSKRKLSVLAKANGRSVPVKPEDEIKDPYILEFLNLKDEYSESQLEEALLRRIEKFLLELGTGFTFVARQKRITIDGRHYRIDLLFYHRVLRCLVALDIKIGEFNHADAGQMNLYLNYLKHKEMLPSEHNPVGIILCSAKGKTLAEYALGGLSNKIFASTYKMRLPDTELLKAELERERNRLLEMNATASPISRRQSKRRNDGLS